MQFSYSEYYRSSFVIPLSFLAFIVFVFLLGYLRKIFAKSKEEPVITFDSMEVEPTLADTKKKKWRKYVEMLISATIFIFLLVVLVVQLSRSYSLTKEKETDAVSIQGVVQDITKMPFPDRYYIDGKVVWSQYIVIDNTKYYCMTADYVEIGDSVEIKYLPIGKHILELEKT